MKRTLVILLTMSLLLSCCAVIYLQAAAAVEGDYSYTVADGKATITGYYGPGGDVIIPTTLGGYPVTTIGEYAFSYCPSLTTVGIPDTVTAIGKSAFWNCPDLQGVHITDIAAWCSIAFESNPLQYAEKLYLNGALVTDLVIPDGVSTISKNAFNYCTSLNTVTIPDSVTSIGEHAFYSCTSIASVTVGANIATIGRSAFDLCNKINCVYLSDIAAWCNIVFDNFYANPIIHARKLYINGEGVTDLVIPEGVTSIGNYAFSDYDGLVSVSIPDSVTTIGEQAFYNCRNLAAMIIGDGVTSIGYRAFSSCLKLTEVTIPESATEIGERAFSGCTTLTEVTIPGSVRTIGSYAFYLCSGLSDVYYQGTQNQWFEIAIADGNTELTGATLHFLTAVLDDCGNAYETLADAIKGVVAGGKLTVFKDIIEDVSVSKSVNIDLNGFSIIGTVTVKDGCILYGMDVQTDDYTIKDGKGYGKIKNVVLEGTGKLKGKDAEGDRHGYMMIQEEDGVSFHCVNLKLNAMTLRAESSGVYFKSDFAGDELVAENVKQFGVALSVKGMPTAETMNKDCIFSKFEDFEQGFNGVGKNSTLLKNIMKKSNAAIINNRNANMPVYGRAYILTNDGQYIFGASASRTLRQQVEAIDTMWTDLSEEQKTSVQQLYADFVNVMKYWTLPNLKETIA